MTTSIVKAGSLTLLDNKGTFAKAKSMGKRASTLRLDTHLALLSGIYLAETDKQGAALQAVVRAIDPTIRPAIKKWMQTYTVYTMRTPKDELPTVAYCGADSIPERAFSMLEESGREALSNLPYWTPTEKADKVKAPFTVAAFVEDLTKRIEREKLNAKQTAALARDLAAFAAQLTVQSVPATETKKAQQKAGKARARKASAKVFGLDQLGAEIAAMESLQNVKTA